MLFYRLTAHDFSFNLFDTSGLLTFPLLVALLIVTLPSVRVRLGKRAAWLERGIIGYTWLQFFGFFIDRLQAGRPELVAWYGLAVALSAVAFVLAIWERSLSQRARFAAPSPVKAP